MNLEKLLQGLFMISAKDLKEISWDLSILYVEDEEILRNSMLPTLQKFFKNIHVAKNGQEALEFYEKESSDIILTDINMPIMNGVELITQINKINSNPIIIVLSAHDESELLISLINLELNSFINKPVEKEILVRVLHKNCSIITNKKLLASYMQQLEEENSIIQRKNIILEQKLNQLAIANNKNIASRSTPQRTSINKQEDSYFKVLLQEDRDELCDLSQELDTYIMMMFQNDSLNNTYLERLVQVYLKYAAVINAYSEFYEIAIVLHEFVEVLITTEQKVLEDTQQTGIFLESLQLTLETFRQNIWEKEAKDPRFYNASLENDIKLIIDFLEEKEIEDNEIEFF